MSKLTVIKSLSTRFLCGLSIVLCLFALNVNAQEPKIYQVSGKRFMPLNVAKPITLASLNDDRRFKTIDGYKQVRRQVNITRDRDYRGVGRVTPHPSDDETVLWPISDATPQRISSPFGYRTHPVTGLRSFHSGIDIAARYGTAVQATHDGIVEEIGTHRNLGKFVKIRHNEEEYSLYGHLSGWTVSKGQPIKAGTIVGKVGSSGRSTGAHLDYSLRRNGKAINPMEVLSLPQHVASLDNAS